MTKAEIRKIVDMAMKERRLCRIYCRYDPNYWYYFPLLVSEKLFLGADEDDFILNGYTIRRFRDVKVAEIKDDLCIKILAEEGITGSVVVPAVDVTSWETVFRSLQKTDKNIIVENESLDAGECEFTIGRIEKVFKHHVYIRHFDAEGIWMDEPTKIPYTAITSVTFASRYVDVFSKYLDELPANLGKI